MNRRWWVAAAALGVAAVLAVVFAVWRPGGGSADHTATEPVLVGSVSLTPSHPARGAAIVAKIRLSADRPLHLDALVLAVRDSRGRSSDAAGRGYDFPDAGPIRLDIHQRTLTVAQQLPDRGRYVYFLRYRRDRTWHDLPPDTAFTVG
ncbi:MAG TPA: hypothetical protein VHC49_23520 [Mycobacteriales bacterium]|nr:hypothetical protein [Mycobacteriales bacterium]